MRGDRVYRVYGVHKGRDRDVYLGAYRTRPEAEAAIETRKSLPVPEGWPEKYHDQGFDIREAVVETDFEIPSLPKPRDKYFVKAVQTNEPGTWTRCTVDVARRDGKAVCTYDRNYAMLQTFEPFRQGGGDFALISRNYTTTAVLDLSTGTVVAEEQDKSGVGFCPVGFYVPDWWDLHDGSIIPGSEYWDADREWQTGQFGFVWGCYWGDDSSWKVQYLDLSRIREGIIRRDDRFGYVALSTTGHQSPVFKPENPRDRSPAPSFIEVSKYQGVPQVRFAVELDFNLETGRLDEDQRLNLSRGGSP